MLGYFSCEQYQKIIMSIPFEICHLILFNCLFLTLYKHKKSVYFQCLYDTGKGGMGRRRDGGI